MHESAFPIGAAASLEELELDPHPLLRRLREREPVSWLPALAAWLVTRRDLALTEQEDVTVYLDNCGQDDAGRPIELSIRCSRKDYEPLIGPLITKTLDLCRGVLERARLNPSAVERLLLVGGPMINQYDIGVGR